MNNLIKTELIENYLKENKLTKAQFCKICNISPSTFKRIMSNGNFRINALFKVARVIEIKFYQIFN